MKSVNQMADWVIRVLDEAGLDAAALAGHSLGSLVALAAAARHPARVRAIALVATAVPMRVSETLLEQTRSQRDVARSDLKVAQTRLDFGAAES